MRAQRGLSYPMEVLANLVVDECNPTSKRFSAEMRGIVELYAESLAGKTADVGKSIAT